MNHFITLDVSKKKLEGKVWRICVLDDPDDEWDPRWKADKKFWNPFHWNATVSQKKLAFTQRSVYQGNKVSFII